MKQYADRFRKLAGGVEVFVFSLAAWLLLFVLDIATKNPTEALQVNDTSFSWEAVESAMGRRGSLESDGSFGFTMPRGDLKVTVAGTPIKPRFALNSWAAFTRTGDSATLMDCATEGKAKVERYRG